MEGARVDSQRDHGLSGADLAACCAACVAEPQCSGYVWADPRELAGKTAGC